MSLNKFTISTGSTSFLLNKVTLFKTPPYSLLVIEKLQINHRYTNILISNVKKNYFSDEFNFNKILGNL